MCGIVGVVGNRNATDILMQGLEKLEYRGYDSAGIFVTNGKTSSLIKSVLLTFTQKSVLMSLEQLVLGIRVGQRTENQVKVTRIRILLKLGALF